jgi:hypothetical protein
LYINSDTQNHYCPNRKGKKEGRWEGKTERKKKDKIKVN